jgi:hypothetical protein
MRTQLLLALWACAGMFAGHDAAHAQSDLLKKGAEAVTSAAAPSPVRGLLGKASDAALDKLAQPGGFYADEAVRILLPGPLKKAGEIMKLTSKAGLTTDLVRAMNDAAGLAAKEAKPIFRDAINGMTINDAVSIAQEGDGATRYLKQSAGDTLKGRLRPLISAALGTTGALTQVDRLNKVKLLRGTGLGSDMLINSVTDQALAGIFTYLGNEERQLRANPLDAGKGLLKGLIN